jgi:two-component system chemotaxis response regulator CheB
VDKSVEDNLWKSVRAIEEAIILLEESGRASAQGGDDTNAERFFNKARENRERANLLHKFIFKQDPLLQQKSPATSQ